MLLFCQKFNISIPKNINRLDDYWYLKKCAKKGALARMKLHGLLGNIETRRKGGIISQQRRRENPKKYFMMGCLVRKTYSVTRVNEDFAEFAGILLSDGRITNNQVRITVSNLVDRDYSKYIVQLMKKIFKYTPSLSFRKKENTIYITLSGVGLVKLLEKYGFKKGNKTKQQVDIPNWIKGKEKFEKACVRGLMDTDGGIYFHNHIVKGKKYKHIGLCFTSFSTPLLNSVSNILKNCKIIHHLKKNRIYLYNLASIKNYFLIFGTSNSKNIIKLGGVA